MRFNPLRRRTPLIRQLVGVAIAWLVLLSPASPFQLHAQAQTSQAYVMQPLANAVGTAGVGHRRCCNRPEVFLLRGGAGYFPKASQFEEALRCRGFQPKTICHWNHRGVADDIAEAYFAGELAGPVTIIGYSSGADAACMMCARLEKACVPVTNLILIESTIGLSVPANVEFCYNIYQTRWADSVPVFRGVAVNAKGANTQMFNVDVNSYSELAPLTTYNHFTMVSAPELHGMVGNLLVQRIFTASPSMQAATSPQPPDAPPAQTAFQAEATSVVK